MQPISPCVGDLFRYEICETSSDRVQLPRWQLTDSFPHELKDEGGAGKYATARVVDINSPWMTLKNDVTGTTFSVPFTEGAHCYSPGQWSRPGFVQVLRSGHEELCLVCKRYKDIEAACWCCGSGNPHVNKYGRDTRRTRY